MPALCLILHLALAPHDSALVRLTVRLPPLSQFLLEPRYPQYAPGGEDAPEAQHLAQHGRKRGVAHTLYVYERAREGVGAAAAATALPEQPEEAEARFGDHNADKPDAGEEVATTPGGDGAGGKGGNSSGGGGGDGSGS